LKLVLHAINAYLVLFADSLRYNGLEQLLKNVLGGSE
jgi:hypothetical protein